jgi:hypothetical protein
VHVCDGARGGGAGSVAGTEAARKNPAYKKGARR